MLTEQQAKAIKEQLISHIDKQFPENKREFAKNQIQAMNSEQIQEFLKNNNISMENSGQANTEMQKCIFCSIASGEVNSYKIQETQNVLAVLEINPISKGHILVIPKSHSSEQSKKSADEIKKIIEEISEKIKKKLKSKKVIVANTNLFGHQIINLIPDYDGGLMEKSHILESEKRHSASPEELEEIKKILFSEKKISKSKKPTIKKIKIKDDKKIWLPKRIP